MLSRVFGKWTGRRRSPERGSSQRGRAEAAINTTACYRAAVDWIRANQVAGAGIRVTHKREIPYPEVSGYFIPTLLDWGEHELARQFARWLLSIQNADGSWSAPGGGPPYTFDTGQILKGLLAIRRRVPEVDEAIQRGCDWLLGQIHADGRVTTSDTSQWGLPGGRTVPEAIHLYALEPLRQAGTILGESRYLQAVDGAVEYYCRQRRLARFDTLAHFHAYVLEALVDLGRPEIAAKGMAEIERLQRPDGAIPAYRNVRWLCSTALAQYAVVWYKLGRCKPAERALECLCRLQNPSGGFFGSYGAGANYFPSEEIGWAVKYLLDALWWRIKTSFDEFALHAPRTIDSHDGRYRLIQEQVRTGSPRTVLDAGCGQGRFLRRLKEDFPAIEAHGMDLSERMLQLLPQGCRRVHGSILNIPCDDDSFDLVFCVEALEHAVNVPCAIRELGRVVNPGGRLVVIDKNRANLGQLETPDWEQWMSAEDVAGLMEQAGFSVTVHRNLAYERRDGADGLFLGWVGVKQAGGRFPC